MCTFIPEMNTQNQISLRAVTESELSFSLKLLSESGLSSDGVSVTAGWIYIGWLDNNPSTPIAVGGIEPAGQFGLLRSIALLPEFRGKGYGRKFCELLIREARGLDYRGLYLLTTTAEPFFASLEFKKTDRDSVPERIAATTEFTQICPDSAICMFLDIQ